METSLDAPSAVTNRNYAADNAPSPVSGGGAGRDYGATGADHQSSGGAGSPTVDAVPSDSTSPHAAGREGPSAGHGTKGGVVTVACCAGF